MEKKDDTCPPEDVTIVDENETDKWVTKRHPGGRTLTMVVVEGVVVEKHVSYKMPWDPDAMRKDEAEGVDSVSFKHWEKGGLSVNNSHCGTHLIGLMIKVEHALAMNPKAKRETLQDETDHDIAFPAVNARKLTMEEGCSPEKKDNPTLGAIMHDCVVRFLKRAAAKDEAADGQELADKKRKAEEVLHQCEVCLEMPCVWITQRNTVIANNECEHGNLLMVTNSTRRSTRRRIAFKHMFHIINGGYGQKGVRTRHPTCVEDGIRALFPDAVPMGFKEKLNLVCKQC
jgi:hypothetical protein